MVGKILLLKIAAEVFLLFLQSPLSDRSEKPFSFQDSPPKLISDVSVRGKIQWHFIPLAFGRSPTAERNPIWIKLEEHIEVVQWWNELNRRRNGINIADWDEDDEWAVIVATYNLIIPNRTEEPYYVPRGLPFLAFNSPIRPLPILIGLYP